MATPLAYTGQNGIYPIHIRIGSSPDYQEQPLGWWFPSYSLTPRVSHRRHPAAQMELATMEVSCWT